MEYGKQTVSESLAALSVCLRGMLAADVEWCAKKRRWIDPTPNDKGEPGVYDLYATLRECLRDIDIRRVARWIEFHVDNGLARRTRLLGVLRGIRSEFDAIEHNVLPDNPFRWMGQSHEDAAREAENEVRHVAEYIDEMRILVERSEAATANETDRTTTVVVPIVHSDARGAAIEWANTRHPVSHDWAAAFRKMIEGKGQPVGIGDTVRKPKEALDRLRVDAPLLAAIVERAAGNRGYRLTVFDAPPGDAR